MLFPSVELTTADGHPLLLLMDPSRTEHHIDDLLSRLDVPIDARGTDVGRSRPSVEQILDQCDENTLVIGTHINGPGGLLEHAGQQRGEVLRNRTLAAAEVYPGQDLEAYWLDGSLREIGRRTPQVHSSDGHCLADIGRRYTLGEDDAAGSGRLALNAAGR